MTCQCLSPNCIAAEHRELACGAEAVEAVMSRDFDGGAYEMCAVCAADAMASGMFEEW